jgi:hypothetical protein
LLIAFLVAMVVAAPAAGALIAKVQSSTSAKATARPGSYAYDLAVNDTSSALLPTVSVAAPGSTRHTQATSVGLESRGVVGIWGRG